MRSLIPMALLLAGCATSPDPFAGQSPLDVDPANLAVSVALSEPVSADALRAELTFAAIRADLGVDAYGSYALRNTGGTFALAPSDVAAAREVQATIAEWEEIAPEDTRGRISVEVAVCDAGLSEEARITVTLQTAPGQPGVALLRDAPLDALGAEARPGGRLCL